MEALALVATVAASTFGIVDTEQAELVPRIPGAAPGLLDIGSETPQLVSLDTVKLVANALTLLDELVTT